MSLALGAGSGGAESVVRTVGVLSEMSHTCEELLIPGYSRHFSGLYSLLICLLGGADDLSREDQFLVDCW